MPTDRYDQPIGTRFCTCVVCQKKQGWPTINRVYDSYSYDHRGGYYGTRRWVPHGRGPAYYGMELELSNCGTSAWETAVGRLGDILAEVKPDGSLMEMTSHPMSLPFFMGHYPWDLLPALAKTGATGNPGSGGIHVHVNKTAFDSADHIYNWWQLYYSNITPMNRLGGRRRLSAPDPYQAQQLASQIYAQVHIAKAVHTGAARSLSRPEGRFLREDDKAIIRTLTAANNPAPYVHGEGDGIATRRHDDTFEVRFPGASINPGVVKHRVQLIAAGVEYTRAAPPSVQFSAFRAWVNQQHSRRYPELAAAMAGL